MSAAGARHIRTKVGDIRSGGAGTRGRQGVIDLVVRVSRLVMLYLADHLNQCPHMMNPQLLSQ